MLEEIFLTCCRTLKYNIQTCKLVEPVCINDEFL